MNTKIIISVAIVLAIFAIGIALIQPSKHLVGSVGQGGEYNATSTPGMADNTNLAKGFGVLGSVVVTGANTGTINIWDATTTAATSKILLASFPASVAAGTYTFDVRYLTGLTIAITGTAPTSTITYR